MAFVQGAQNNATGTSVACSFGSNAAANLILVFARTNLSGNAMTVSDSAANSYASAGFVDNATSGWRFQVWYTYNVAARVTTNTITVVVGASANTTIVAVEYSGVATSSVVDGSPVFANGSGTAPSSGPVGVTAGNLFIGSAANLAGNLNAGSGFTGRWSYNNIYVEDNFSTSSSNTAVLTSASGQWSAFGISLVVASKGTNTAANANAGLTNQDLLAKHQRMVPPSSVGSGSGPNTPVPVASVLKQASIGAAYSETISAQGGSSPYTFSLAAGSLPPGLSLNGSTGVISGTATGTPATYSFTIGVTDSLSQTGSTAFSISTVFPGGGGSYAFLA